MKKSWYIAGLVVAAGAVVAGAVLMYSLPLDTRDRSPQQPLAFSHKVHAGDNLPDHVYFPHMMHIRAKLACSVCHGEVAAMELITRKSVSRWAGA